MRWAATRSPSRPAISPATAGSIWPSPMVETCRCCWATVTARSSPPSITRSDAAPSRSWLGTSRLRQARPGRRKQLHRVGIQILMGNGTGRFNPRSRSRRWIRRSHLGRRFQRRRPARPGVLHTRTHRKDRHAAGQRRRYIPGPEAATDAFHREGISFVAGDFTGDGQPRPGHRPTCDTDDIFVLLDNGDGTFADTGSHGYWAGSIRDGGG